MSAMLLVSLACNLGAARPGTPTPVDTVPADGVDQNTPQPPVESPGGATVEVVVTEAQLTKLVNETLQNQSDPPIVEPQILLRDGQIEFSGKTANQPIQADVNAVMTVQVDATGQPVFDLVSADLGPFPVPQAMLDQIEGQLDQALRAELQSKTAGITIESITIADGEMTILGRSN